MKLDRIRPALLALVLGLAGAGVVYASVAHLELRATLLLGDYDQLQADVESCPNGECVNAPDILQRKADLEAERLILEDDRDAITPCSTCQTLDGMLGDLEDVALEVAAGTGGWEEVS